MSLYVKNYTQLRHVTNQDMDCSFGLRLGRHREKTAQTEASLYTILQILSLTLFDKIPFDQLLKNSEIQMTIQQNNNQLNLFN
jgi:hypothetical protein